MALRGVIFDLGGTLLHYNAPNMTWEDTEKKGARSVYILLHEEGYALPPEKEALNAAWNYAITMWNTLLRPDHDVKALKLDVQLQRMVEQAWRAGPIPDSIGARLAQAYMDTVQTHVHPLEGAAITLRTLRDQGLRVGLISNTVWPGTAHRADLERFGLIDYLEHLIFSADAEAWKPYRAVFQMALDVLGLQPDEAAYIGDSLFFDVWGAQQAGLRGVWIEQQHRWLPDGMEVTPDATLKTLPDLLAIVKGWQKT